MPERRVRPSQRSLSPDEARVVGQIEDLYGAPRWRWGDWDGAPQGLVAAARARMQLKKPPLSSVIPRTALLLALAFLAWDWAVGDRVVEQALLIPLKATGLVRTTPVPVPPAEYLLALRTVRPGESLAPNAPVVLQFKGLLDQIAPKCKEDRAALTSAILAADDALVARSVEGSALAVLAQANAILSSQARGPSPANCTETIDRVAASLRFSN